MATNRLLSDESPKKTEDYLAEVVRLARESKTHLTNLKVRDLETVLKQVQAVRRERQAKPEAK
jgi:hypothetical protein